MSALIVSVWRRRCCLWTDDLIDFVLHWVKWQWWTDGWEKRLWFQPRMSHAKPETASTLAQPIVSLAAVSYSPSARTEHDLARAIFFILQSWCMWGTLCRLTTLSYKTHCCRWFEFWQEYAWILRWNLLCAEFRLGLPADLFFILRMGKVSSLMSHS